MCLIGSGPQKILKKNDIQFRCERSQDPFDIEFDWLWPCDDEETISPKQQVK